MLARIDSESPLPRPLGKTFRAAHPLLYGFALEFAAALEATWGTKPVPAVELDYLGLHLGMHLAVSLEERDQVLVTLVTPKYDESASRLESQISQAIKGVGVVQRVVQRMDVDFSEISSDLIVSTVAPVGGRSAPVIVIDPLPSRRDLDNVAHAARVEREKSIRRRIRTALSTLLDPDLFIHHPGPLRREDAVQLLTDKLQRAGYTKPGFYDDVLDRERWSSTAFGGNFAIPHSMKMDAHGTAIAAMVCDDGIEWGDDTVHLVLMFALSQDGRVVFRDVLDEITRLLAEGYPVKELIEAGQDAEQFIETFMGLLDGEPRL